MDRFSLKSDHISLLLSRGHISLAQVTSQHAGHFRYIHHTITTEKERVHAVEINPKDKESTFGSQAQTATIAHLPVLTSPSIERGVYNTPKRKVIQRQEMKPPATACPDMQKASPASTSSRSRSSQRTININQARLARRLLSHQFVSISSHAHRFQESTLTPWPAGRPIQLLVASRLTT